MAKTRNMKRIGYGRVAPQLKFQVTQEHCDEGCRRNSNTCMIDMAVLVKFPGATYQKASTSEVAWTDPVSRLRYRYFAPPRCAQAIRDFDKGKKVKPFLLRLQEGVVLPSGWKAKHPGSTRKGIRYKRTGRVGVRYTKSRSFGARNIKNWEEGA